MSRWLRLGVLLAAATLTISTDATSARADGEYRLTVASVDDGQSPATATFTVLGPDSRPISGLRPEQVRLDESGHAAQVAGLQRAVDANVGIGVALVLDTSGSMATSLAPARDAAKAFVAGLSPVDQAAVISFSNTVRTEQEMTGDRAALGAALDRLRATGNTALYQAVVQGVQAASQAALPRRVVVLLSDGDDFGGVSATTRQGALDAAVGSGVPVYAIAFGAGADRAFLSELAEQTRGRLLIAPTPADAATAYSELGNLLRSQYIVSFTSTAPPELRQRSLRIRVVVGQASGETSFAFQTKQPAPQSTAASAATTEAAAPLTPPAEDASGSSLPLLPIALVALFAFAGGGFVLLRRRRRTGEEKRPILPIGAVRDLRLRPQDMTTERSEQQALLTMLTGSMAGQTIAVGPEELVTLGSASTCTIELPSPDEAIAEEHARVWWREDKLMFHHVGRARTSSISGEEKRWATLQEGDVIEIGPYQVRVEVSTARRSEAAATLNRRNGKTPADDA